MNINLSPSIVNKLIILKILSNYCKHYLISAYQSKDKDKKEHVNENIFGLLNDN